MEQGSSEQRPVRVAMVWLAGDTQQPGAAKPVPELASALADQSHEVTLYVPPAPAESVQPAGVEVVTLPTEEVHEPDGGNDVGELAAELTDAISDAQPDVIHSHGWLAGLAVHLANHGSVPVTHSFHDLRLLHDRCLPEPRRASPHRYQLERAIARKSDQVIAASGAEEECLRHVGVATDRLNIVPDGVDAESLSPSGRTETSRAKHRVVLLGTLGKVRLAVRALRMLPDTELVFARPSWPAQPRRRVMELAANLRVADRVRTVETPNVGRRGEVLRSADVVLVLGSAEQADALSLEAMACAVPVALGQSQICDSVVDGVTGVRASSDRPTDLAKTLTHLLENTALREGMGLAGRDRAINRYAWSRVAGDTARVYRLALT